MKHLWCFIIEIEVQRTKIYCKTITAVSSLLSADIYICKGDETRKAFNANTDELSIFVSPIPAEIEVQRTKISARR